MKTRLASFAALLSLWAAGPLLHATQTDKFGIHAVPAPNEVTIDGQLNDWDRSGEILICYDIAT